jgi:hypothetical protein
VQQVQQELKVRQELKGVKGLKELKVRIQELREFLAL